MSLTKQLPLCVVRALHKNGERRVYLIGSNGLEDDYSALYVTKNLRNAGSSLSSHEAALNAINVFYAFCLDRGIAVLERFRSGQYLTNYDCMALADFSIQNFGSESKRIQKVVALGKVRKGFTYSIPPVTRDTRYKRMTHIAAFVNWLGRYLLTGESEERVNKIEEMRDEILRLRPKSGSARDDFETKYFTTHDNDVLNSLIEPGSSKNPFSEGVQLRNLLIIEILRQCGIRIGEALNLQIRDIDHIKREMTIKRRHDDIEDPRIDQPLVKTNGRVIPISLFLTDLIIAYLVQRRTVPGAKKNKYLLVTFKSGPTQGQPMTHGAVDSMLQTLDEADNRLSHISSHKFRHFFSSELASEQLANGTDENSQELHRRTRNYIAGRKPHSDVDALYVEQNTKRQARDVMLTVQEKLARPRKGEIQ